MKGMVISLKWEVIEEKGEIKERSEKINGGLIIKEIKLDTEEWKKKDVC